MIIQSVQNPKIKHLVQLHNKKFREKNREFIAQGFKTCATLLENGLTMKSIFFTQEMYAAHQQDFLIQETYLVTDAIARLISTLTNPAGIVAIFAMPEAHLSISDQTVILHEIQDPGNLGTLIRTAQAMNIDTVCMIGCVDLYNPKVVQSAAGSFGRINLIETTQQLLQPHLVGKTTCALVVKSGLLPHQVPLASSILVIGSEGQGLAQSVVQNCTYALTLPMPGNAESLNAAVAGSIAMYLKSQSL